VEQKCLELLCAERPEQLKTITGCVKQPNHSFFCAFAPRENPKIAIMCVVENSGRFGGTYAAPIVSLMIEKYLNDTIAANRKPLEERMSGIDLIPPLMKQKMRSRDSLSKAKEVEKESRNDLKNSNDTCHPGIIQ
jgi:penicillin-binding protein 2